MKITIDAKSFSNAISWVVKTFNPRESSSYISLHLDPKTNESSLSYLNATSYLKASIQILETEGIQGISPLHFAIDGEYLQRLAKSLGSVSLPIVLEEDKKKNALIMTTDNASFTIPTFEFKKPKDPKITALGEVDDREMFDSLLRVSKLCDIHNSGSIPALSAVDINLKPKEKKVTLMATDRYTLAEVEIDFEPSEKAQNFVNRVARKNEKKKTSILLPVEDAIRIPPSKGVTSTTSLVYEEVGEKFGFRFADGRVAVFSLRDGDPLNYQSMKEFSDSDHDNNIVLEVSEFKKALQTVSSLAWEERDFYIDFDKTEAVVRDQNSSNQIAFTYEEGELAEPFTAVFSREILLESLYPVSTGKVKISWNNEVQKYCLKPVLDNSEVQPGIFVMTVAKS